MRFPAVVAVFLSLISAVAFGGVGDRAYLDLEAGDYASVFNQPGKDYGTCRQDPSCKPVGWPDRDSRIKILSPVKKINAYNTITGLNEDQEYVLVEFSYERTAMDPDTHKMKKFKQAGQGWINAAIVSDQKKKAFFTEDMQIVEICPDRKTADPKVPKEVQSLNRTLGGTNVLSISEALKSLTGQCVINPKKPPRYASGNSYDNYVLPQLRKQKLPNVTDEDGRPITTQDLIDIDSMARTLYGEMAGCFKYGLQYPMAVARIIRNRAEAPGRSREFIPTVHSGEKSKIARVATSPTQFNVWMPKVNAAPNNSLKLALCPPSDPGKNSWQGHKPSSEELEIWQNALRISTETVLFPKKFAQRTAQVTQYFYTSGVGAFYKMQQVFPWIENR